MIAAVYENRATLMRYVLLALCSAFFMGCARLHFTVSPSSNSNNQFLEQVDVNGVLTWAILPGSYNSRNPTPWIVYDHGFGQTIISIVTDPPHRAFVQSLATAGFVVVASEYRNLFCWGNMECAEDVANLQTLWRSKLNLSPAPFVIGESMGGIVTWNAISHGTLEPLAVVGIYPVCNLADMYLNNGFVPTIQSAYGFTSPSGYVAATHGFDPMLDLPSIFAGIPIQIWASRSDHLVVRSRNADPFAKAINAAGGSVTIHTTRGDHGDPSNLDAAGVISFFSSVPLSAWDRPQGRWPYGADAYPGSARDLVSGVQDGMTAELSTGAKATPPIAIRFRGQQAESQWFQSRDEVRSRGDESPSDY